MLNTQHITNVLKELESDKWHIEIWKPFEDAKDQVFIANKTAIICQVFDERSGVTEFLANTPNTTKALLAEVKELRKVLKQLVDACTNDSSFDEVNLALVAADNILKEEF